MAKIRFLPSRRKIAEFRHLQPRICPAAGFPIGCAWPARRGVAADPGDRMVSQHPNSFKTRRTLTVGARSYEYFSLAVAAKAGIGDIERLPFSLKVLLENLLRHEDGRTVTREDIAAVGAWLTERRSDREIA